MKITTSDEMEQFGRTLGQQLKGGEIIELIGDVGAGKTTLTRGIARGLNIEGPITSPSFTINCNYNGRDNLVLHHYDFYRLSDAGIVQMELAESISDQNSITIIEWGDSVKGVLPNKRICININYLPEAGRQIEISGIKNFPHLHI